MAATVEESTPPDIATAMVVGSVIGTNRISGVSGVGGVSVASAAITD
jgi:hypothetical protein